MMNTPHKQRGLSLLSWMIILTMSGVMLLTGIKLAPVYYEYYVVSEILKKMQVEPSLKGAQKQKVASSLGKRLNISQVYGITRKDYTITKVKGKRGYVVDLDYEVRKPLFANLSIIAVFKSSVEVGG